MNSFRIETKEEFFKILDCDEDTVTSAIKDKEKAYFKYKLQKKIGSRYIYGLVKDNLIYTLQKKINREIFKNILFPDYRTASTHGYYLKNNCATLYRIANKITLDY